MRLDKFLGNLKYGSRKEIKELCKKCSIKVDGKIILDSSYDINPNLNKVSVFDEEVFYKEHITLMMNKPAHYICSTKDEFYPSILRLLDEKYQRFDFSIAGRLDEDTEGLIILTTDGDLVHKIISPKKEIDKTYYVKTRLPIQNEALLEKGLTILDGKNEPYVTKASKALKIGSNELLLTIHEGKFHQVKRMLEKIGNEVIYLKRIQVGNCKLNENLALGEAVEIKAEDILS